MSYFIIKRMPLRKVRRDEGNNFFVFIFTFAMDFHGFSKGKINI